MNTIQKTFLYPIISLAIIVLMVSINWLLTAFLSVIFNSTINDVAASPIILIYVLSFIATVFMIINCCEYIDRQL
jgi:hypothetical protein